MTTQFRDVWARSREPKNSKAAWDYDQQESIIILWPGKQKEVSGIFPEP